MKYLNDFLVYLKNELNYSNYTIKNYELDIYDYISFCNENKIDIYNIKYNEVKKYLINIHNKKYKSSSVSRKISSLRTFYGYLYDNNLINNNILKFIS